MENIKNTVQSPGSGNIPLKHGPSPKVQASPSPHLGTIKHSTFVDKVIQASPSPHLGTIKHSTFVDSVIQASPSPHLGTIKHSTFVEQASPPPHLGTIKNSTFVDTPSPHFGPRRNSTITEQTVIEKACSPSIVPKNSEIVLPPGRRCTFPRTEAEEIHENRKKSQDLSIILNQFKQELITYVGKRIDVLQYEMILQNKLPK